MNRRLTTEQIRSTCRELLARHGAVPCRELRRELRRRYGTPGSTSRVFRIWRETVGAPDTVTAYETGVVARATAALADATRQVERAERDRMAAIERAERAEAREEAHQARWAREIDALRVELGHTAAHRDRIRQLEETVLRMSRELAELRSRLRDATGLR